MSRQDPSPLDPTATLRLDAGPRGVKLSIEGIRLVVVRGPDQGREAGFELPVVRIGSGREADLVLTDPAVSRRHAEVRVLPGRLVIRDCGSTNGIRVRGLRITEADLEPGTEVELGGTCLRVERRTAEHRAMISEEESLCSLVGGSPAMRKVFALLRALGPTPASVLVLGESGTGKELVARTLHELSGRSGPLVVFDAASADPELIRSDLFGHAKGAFTGAAEAREGALRRADRGTLFLDEIGELPLDLQPRLLRVLESREVVAVGTDKPVPVDVRLVAATHRDLPRMVSEGTFREDLYHRLAVVTLTLPPLRDRPEDIPGIARTLLARLAPGRTLSPGAEAALVAHPWPGNVRALRNALERASYLAPPGPLEAEHLLLPEAPGASGTSPRPAPPPTRIEDAEKAMILSALAEAGGNKTAAARALGISLGTLRRRLKEYGADDPPGSPTAPT